MDTWTPGPARASTRWTCRRPRSGSRHPPGPRDDRHKTDGQHRSKGDEAETAVRTVDFNFDAILAAYLPRDGHQAIPEDLQVGPRLPQSAGGRNEDQGIHARYQARAEEYEKRQRQAKPGPNTGHELDVSASHSPH